MHYGTRTGWTRESLNRHHPCKCRDGVRQTEIPVIAAGDIDDARAFLGVLTLEKEGWCS